MSDLHTRAHLNCTLPFPLQWERNGVKKNRPKNFLSALDAWICIYLILFLDFSISEVSLIFHYFVAAS